MRTLITLIGAAALIYVLMCAMLYAMQERMVFLANLPGRELDAFPSDIGLTYDDVNVRTADGVTLHGWHVHAREPRGTVLFFHGNAGNISHRLDSIAIFNELGFDTLIIDYRGYGRSEGKPGEEGTYKDALAAWDYLVNERGADPATIVIFGRSIGGAVAAWLADRQQPAALIVESSFTSAVDMAAKLYPILPVRLLTRLNYPAIDYVAKVTCPVLIVHSRGDDIIPFAMGRALYEAASEPKAFLELEGDHNNGFILSRDRYRRGLAGFLEALSGDRADR
jgi:fermentation-respiration switch protein FrsA (DUF1100 family)